MDTEKKEILSKIANTIRHLSMDAIQKAGSGHPGLPLGCAEIGAYLYGNLLHHYPKNPSWVNRDRFILSAGHGSMLLYSCLHLAGFSLSLEDIMQFRQLHAKTPGHPEYEETPGVETTSGPLGQGVANGVGQALGLKILADRFNTSEVKIFHSKVFVLAGDGCIMEGISSEASSFAGHLGLDNLVLIYDANQICLDGSLSECFSEDVAARYRAYGWEVFTVDGHSFEDLDQLFSGFRERQKAPWLVIANTTIGKGSPHKEGTHKAHGAPLGEEEVKATRLALGLSEEDFFVPQSVKAFFTEKLEKDKEREALWREKFERWKEEHPDKHALFKKMEEKTLPSDLEEQISQLEIEPPIAGRTASHQVIQLLANIFPQLIGGSADLSCSDMTMIKKEKIFSRKNFQGRNCKFGVREFSMAAICTGLAETKMILPFCGTFLAFSDYMRNAIRLAALMKVQVIYQFTHDSLFLGEDGPTHQPIEHLAALRAIPHLQVIRPADQNELKMAWIAALSFQGPTALILSRQKLPDLSPSTSSSFASTVGRGAYIVKHENADYPIDCTFFSTGSELFLAMEVAKELVGLGKNVRVVSMPCWKIFERQDRKYYESVVGGDLGKRVSIEAGVDLGWHKYTGREGITIAMDSFGLSAPYKELEKEFGFTVEHILERIVS